MWTIPGALSLCRTEAEQEKHVPDFPTRPTLSPARHEDGPVKRVVWLSVKAEFVQMDTMGRLNKGGWKEDGGDRSPLV